MQKKNILSVSIFIVFSAISLFSYHSANILKNTNKRGVKIYEKAFLLSFEKGSFEKAVLYDSLSSELINHKKHWAIDKTLVKL